jgi:general secretion pathway protein G
MTPVRGRRSPSGGFTFIELAVTVAIIAVLTTAVLPLAQLTARREKEHALRADLIQMRDAIDAYKTASDAGRFQHPADATGYPPDLDVLVQGVEDARDPAKHRIYFLRTIPRDPFFEDPGVPAAQTWTTRSYDSPPDDPHSGRDVYDVHSTASGTALDGTAYRSW